MRRLFKKIKNKSKILPRPPQPGIPTNIADGTPGFRVEQVIAPKGGQSRIRAEALIDLI
jgi:hypothetical protein